MVDGYTCRVRAPPTIRSTPVEYRRLGTTDLTVSTLCFGNWQGAGDWGDIPEDQLLATTRRAFDLGIRFFDTAQAYGFGRAEELLGRALAGQLKGSARDEVVIATKGGLRAVGRDGDDGVTRDSSPGWLRQGIDDSLRALGVDHIDVYAVHWPDVDTPFDETARALEDAVQAGKIRYVGLSNFSTEQLDAFAETRPVDAYQPGYHLFRRTIEESELPWCAEHGTGVYVYGPMAHGMATGKMTPDHQFEESDWRGSSDDFRGEGFRTNLAIVDRLEAFARERDHTMPELAVAWTLSHPAIDAAIVGARNPEQVEGVIGAGDFPLSAEDRAAIDQLLEGASPVRGLTPEG